MPRLPAPEDYGMSSPRPSRGVTEISAVQVRPDLATGKAMQDIGLMMRQEAEKLDETVALDALNQLQNKQLELTYGDNGFTKVQGKGVIDRKITAEFPTQLQTEMDRLSGTINSNAAKQRFQAQASSVMRGFKANVYGHAAKETETYHVATDNAQFATSQNMAAQGDLPGALAHAAPALARAIERNGLEGDAAADFARKSMGGVYYSAILSQAKTSPSRAATMLEESRGLMTPEQVKHLDTFVKSKSDYSGALALANEAEAQGLKGRAALDFFTKGAGENEEMKTKAAALHAERLQANQKVEHEATGKLSFMFDQMPPTRASLAKIKASDEFNASTTTDTVRSAAMNYMQRRIEHAEDRNRIAGDRATLLEEKRRAEDPEVQAIIENLTADPSALLAYSPAQMKGFLPGLVGNKFTDALIKHRNAVEKVADTYTLPADLIKTSMPLKLQQAKGDAETQQKNTFVTLANMSLLEWKAANPGRTPNEAEARQIVLEGNAEWVKLSKNKWYEFGEQRAKGYEIPGDVPAVPAKFEAELRERFGPEQYKAFTPEAKKNLWNNHLATLQRKGKK